MADIIAGRYEILDVVAVEWNPALAERFPAADHHGCRQEMWHDGDTWQRFEPVRCVGYHCPNCGVWNKSIPDPRGQERARWSGFRPRRPT